MDSDDWVDETAYKAILGKLKELSGGSETIDMFLANYVYEKEGAKHKKVMRQLGFPKDKVFTWNDIRHFYKGHYILMHSVIYRTQLLRRCITWMLISIVITLEGMTSLLTNLS